jgi:hypothetical protein
MYVVITFKGIIRGFLQAAITRDKWQPELQAAHSVVWMQKTQERQSKHPHEL